ncbi:hypothetical protein EYF80_027671 [Liparis tanakae]|uniref:Uncharacterized protein n=1 Tax=Liparis tanakae TaxID=230148 RepID=A0A4Z2H974_9TELE|nr:hypothetical protein EYF80_027671 [Liparis tanakae]
MSVVYEGREAPLEYTAVVERSLGSGGELGDRKVVVTGVPVAVATLRRVFVRMLVVAGLRSAAAAVMLVRLMPSVSRVCSKAFSGTAKASSFFSPFAITDGFWVARPHLQPFFSAGFLYVGLTGAGGTRQPAINRWSLPPSLVLEPPPLRALAWGFLRPASTCFLAPLLWLGAGRLSLGGAPFGRAEYVCAGTVKEGVGGCMYRV